MRRALWRGASFEAVAVETGFGANLTGSGDPERVPGTRVSGDWLRALGVTPMLGRALTRDDDEPGKDKVVVLSHGLWTRLFAANRSAIGKTIELNGESYQIVGQSLSKHPVVGAGDTASFDRGVGRR